MGVYKGKFARYINLYFKERKLYLFDTFEGFGERDVDTEKKEGFSSGSQNFSDTSIESVLELMPYVKNCIPVKGFFPESVKGIKDKFVFVSLDADLYEPIYEGLKFFLSFARFRVVISLCMILIMIIIPEPGKQLKSFAAEKNISHLYQFQIQPDQQ